MTLCQPQRMARDMISPKKCRRWQLQLQGNCMRCGIIGNNDNLVKSCKCPGEVAHLPERRNHKHVTVHVVQLWSPLMESLTGPHINKRWNASWRHFKERLLCATSFEVHVFINTTCWRHLRTTRAVHIEYGNSLLLALQCPFILCFRKMAPITSMPVRSSTRAAKGHNNTDESASRSSLIDKHSSGIEDTCMLQKVINTSCLCSYLILGYTRVI